jgi:hypothetical protein
MNKRHSLCLSLPLEEKALAMLHNFLVDITAVNRIVSCMQILERTKIIYEFLHLPL